MRSCALMPFFIPFFCLDFSVDDDPNGFAVNYGFDPAVVVFDEFQAQDQQRPQNQHEEKLQQADAVAVNHAADDAAEYIVLHLVHGGGRCEVAFT